MSEPERGQPIPYRPRFIRCPSCALAGRRGVVGENLGAGVVRICVRGRMYETPLIIRFYCEVCREWFAPKGEDSKGEGDSGGLVIPGGL